MTNVETKPINPLDWNKSLLEKHKNNHITFLVVSDLLELLIGIIFESGGKDIFC